MGNEFISGSFKPVRVGVYKRKYYAVYFSYFDGNNWLCLAKHLNYVRVTDYKSIHQKLPWCGLSKAEYDAEVKRLWG